MDPRTKQLIEAYEALGKQWLAGKVIIESFNCSCQSQESHKEARLSGKCEGFWLNPKQLRYVNSKSPEILISGGYRSGKTIAMIIKMYLLSMFFPNNRLLLGRKTISDLESATLPAVFDVFPKGTYNYRAGPGIIEFPNGSQILLYALDTSVSGDDTKRGTQPIKGLDLGGVFIDQLEEVAELMYEHASGRLSRNVPFHQMCSTTNPANFWAHSRFKQKPRKGTELIETGMIDNRENLPDGFIEQQLEKGEMYVRRFVYGEWSPDVLVEGVVFGSDIQKEQKLWSRNPIRELAGVKIFKEPEQHEYQIGIDPSIGATDPCAIVVVDKVTGEVVATFSGFVPTNVITLKAVLLADMYSTVKPPLIIPEATGVGQALVEDLKKQYDHIYEREVFSKRENKTVDKLGFYTNYATKIQLIEGMTKLFQARWPKILDAEIQGEMQTFIWSDEANRKGAGAQDNYHDDLLMGTMLAYWGLKPVSFKARNILENRQKTPSKITYQYQ